MTHKLKQKILLHVEILSVDNRITVENRVDEDSPLAVLEPSNILLHFLTCIKKYHATE
jgi:hypothetical protein